MKNLLLKVLQLFCYFYPIEYGRYTILTKFYFPYFVPIKNNIRIKKIKNKILMELDINEYLQAYLFLFEKYESKTLKFYKKYIKKGDIILDVGANIGYFSLIFSKLTGSKGRVYAFEPETNNFSKLQNNILLNKSNNIYIFKVACSNVEEKLKLYLSESCNKGTHSLIKKEYLDSQKYEIVKTIKLDDFILSNNINKINLVKIDVEGAELEVIKGLHNILINSCPILIVEVVSSILAKRNLTAKEFCLYLFNNYNYYPFIINSNGNLKKLNIDNIEEISDNIVFKKI